MSITKTALSRLMVVLMAVVLAVGFMPQFTLPAFAGDTATEHTITINEPTGNVDTHSYEAYQVFAGTYNTTTKQLESITWGAGVDGSALLAALKADATLGSIFKDATDAPTAAAAMSGLKADQTAAMAKIIAGNLKTVAATGKSPLSVEGDGYYFVKDASTSLTSDTYSKYILQVCDNVEITAKDTTTTSQKKVKDANTSTGETSDWQGSADYAIGDKVPFQLTGTVASDYADYKAPYYFAFHDEFNSAQLGQPEEVVVTIDGTAVDSSLYTVSAAADGNGFDVVFTDLKQTAAKAGSKVVVEYKSQLLSGANIGAKGNINSSNIEFSNNSNGEQHGTTPKDTVIVFTYTVNVNKVNENGDALKGAGFTLYKQGTDQTWTKVKEIAAGETTTFSFVGIDDGTYKLEETTVPTGYNKMDDIVFTVTADHNVDFGSSQVDQDGKMGTAYVLKGLEATSQTATFTANTAKGTNEYTGTIDTNVVNKSGSTLPSTGGVGIAPFIIGGAIIVIAAIAGLVIRRRKHSNIA